MFVSGYEHHTLECFACGETEQRLVFRHPGEPSQEHRPTPPPDRRGAAQSVEKTALAPDEPQAQDTVSQGTPWQRDIQNIRVRLDDLRQRGELAKEAEVRREHEEQARRRFKVFWEGLGVPKQMEEPRASRLVPLPRSRSLVVAGPV